MHRPQPSASAAAYENPHGVNFGAWAMAQALVCEEATVIDDSGHAVLSLESYPVEVGSALEKPKAWVRVLPISVSWVELERSWYIQRRESVLRILC